MSEIITKGILLVTPIIIAFLALSGREKQK